MKLQIPKKKNMKKNGNVKTKRNLKSQPLREVEILKNQLARALADYDNLQKRVELEREEITKISNFRLALRFLGLHDMLEETQKHLNDSGVAMIVKEFDSAILDSGIEKIAVEKNDKFDENLHEVVEAIPGTEGGKIAEVVLPGWKYVDGKVIRHAKVKVIRKEK